MKTKHKLIEYRTNYPNSPIRKALKLSEFPELEKALLIWFYQQRSENKPISQQILALKSKQFYEQIYKDKQNVKPFKGSLGFVQNFCSRNRITTKSIYGESESSDKSEAAIFVDQKFPGLIEGYSNEQIYNADETGLNYVGLPNSTLCTFEQKAAKGFKAYKNRVTLMVCANASGNHKLPLVFVHKFENPKCFSTIDAFGRKEKLDKQRLPVFYKSSTNAWMTMEIFESWFFSQFVPKFVFYKSEATFHHTLSEKYA